MISFENVEINFSEIANEIIYTYLFIVLQILIHHVSLAILVLLNECNAQMTVDIYHKSISILLASYDIEYIRRHVATSDHP